MNGDVSPNQTKDAHTLKKQLKIDTHSTTASSIIHDVDALMSCINLWKKESRVHPNLKEIDAFENSLTQGQNPTNSLNELKHFKSSINDKYVNLGGLNTKVDQARAEGNEFYHSLEDFDEKHIISELSYPIDYDYEKMCVSRKTMTEKDSRASSDTRLGTDESDINSFIKTQTEASDNVESRTTKRFDYTGKNIDPKFSGNGSFNTNRSENGNGSTNEVFNTVDSENRNLMQSGNSGIRTFRNLNEMIGGFIKGESYLTSGYVDQASLKRTLDDNNGFEDPNFIEDVLVAENSHRRAEEDLESEENPILSMRSRETQLPIITERDILVYGKSESHSEETVTPMNKDDESKRSNMVRDVSVNCQIDQILSNNGEGEDFIEEPEKIRGVCFCKSDNSWTAWWTEKGKSRKKAFKLSLYGYDEARRRAIEHRMYVESLLPELKHKKAKLGKKKLVESPTAADQVNTPTEVTHPVVSGDQGMIETDKTPETPKGIFTGTRNRTREVQNHGVYFKDNAWHAAFIDIEGNSVTKSFPVNKDMPYISARNQALIAYNQGTLKGANPIIQGEQVGTEYNSYQHYNNASARNVEMYKRRKLIQTQLDQRQEPQEYFRNLEKKLEEDLRNSQNNASQNNAKPNTTHSISQITSSPQIFMQSLQEFKIPQQELTAETIPEETIREGTRFNSLHCQIKLEKSILDEIHKAINKSLSENGSQIDPGSENNFENDAETIATHSARSTDKVNEQTINSEKEENSDKVFKSVNALCISKTDSEKTTSISILPTYIKGPQNTQLLTFVILNS